MTDRDEGTEAGRIAADFAKFLDGKGP